MPTIAPAPPHSVRTPAQKSRDRRALRWARARTVWHLGDWIANGCSRCNRIHHKGRLYDHRPVVAGWDHVPFRRSAGCGRIVTAESGLVQIRRKQGEHGPTSYASGVQVCGSVWNCPNCQAKIKTRRGVELSLAGTRHIDTGGTIGILTLTLRHQRAHRLVDLVDGLNAAYRELQQSSEWRHLRKPLIGHDPHVSPKNGRTYWRAVYSDTPVMHTAKALEVTRGENGWHPHLHVLVLAPDHATLDQLFALAEERWAALVVKHLGPHCRPNKANGVNLIAAPEGSRGAAKNLARYISKFTLEATRSDVKGSDALGSLLDDIESDDTGRRHLGIAEYTEWARAMHGRRAVVFSDGLRDLYLPDVEDKDDEELAIEQEDGEVTAEIPRAEWIAFARAGTIPEVLDRCDDGDIPPRWRPPPGTPVRPPNRHVRRARDRQVVGCSELASVDLRV